MVAGTTLALSGTAAAHASPLRHGTGARPATGTSAQATTCTPAGASSLKADFNGDGRDDQALFYNYGGGHVALFTMTTLGCGSSIDSPVLQWDAPDWGTGTKFVTSGDFNGDGKADIALLYYYGGTHVALWTLTADANGDGGFAPPVLRWDAPYWGGGTKFVTTGDFNGDGKADIALLYYYGGTHVAVYTLGGSPAGDGSFTDPIAQWDGLYWGSGTKFVTTGDFNGDGKRDIALFYAYSGGPHVAVYTLTADPSGAGTLAGPTLRWDAPNWGSGTKMLTAGKYTNDANDDLALFYYYGGNQVATFTLTADGNGDGGFETLFMSWSASSWGPGTRFMTSGNYTGSLDGLHLFYDYGTDRVALYAVDPAIMSAIAPDDLWDTPYWGTGTQVVL